MILTETRKEDELYFNGCFWIVADSFRDILRNKYKIISDKYLVDFNGNSVEKVSKSSRTHKSVWKEKFQSQYPDKDYYYYPRGRVGIYNGECYINLNGKLLMNPNIINNIYKEFDLSPIPCQDIEITAIDELQGPHYDFELK